MSLLIAQDIEVTASFGGKKIQVLRDINFELPAGKVLGLIGESGAGKSMIGKLISGMLPPGFQVTRGSLRLRAIDLLKLGAGARRALLGKQIGYIPQEPRAALNPVLSIGDQFCEHLHNGGIDGVRKRRELAESMLAAVRLPEPGQIMGRFAHELSGRQCQRVMIAMAFANSPALVIADEPTTALDVVTQATIMRLISEIQRSHETSIVLITHDLRMAAHVCDQTIVLYAGDIVEKRSSASILAQPRHPYTSSLRDASLPLNGERRALTPLPDVMPSLSKFADLAGCRFAPRCAHAIGRCHAEPVSMSPLGQDATARCCRLVELKLDQDFGRTLRSTRRTGTGLPILEVRGLKKHYVDGRLFGRARAVAALNQLDFVLEQGEFVGILGESGSGKSTFAKLLLGIESPSAGRILIDGQDALAGRDARERRIRNIQMVFQDPQLALNPRRTVADLVTSAMSVTSGKWSQTQRQDRARQLLGEVGLSPDLADRYPAQLSGGQRQRVSIARALCEAPRILVADEILSGLDVTTQIQILTLLLKLREERDFSLILISHDISAVRYLCSRVVVLRAGDAVEMGAVDEVLGMPQHKYTQSLIEAIPPDDANAVWPPPSRERLPGAH